MTTENKIRLEAYFIWERSGKSAEDCWLEAERKIQSQQKKSRKESPRKKTNLATMSDDDLLLFTAANG